MKTRELLSKLDLESIKNTAIDKYDLGNYLEEIEYQDKVLIVDVLNKYDGLISGFISDKVYWYKFYYFVCIEDYCGEDDLSKKRNYLILDIGLDVLDYLDLPWYDLFELLDLEIIGYFTEHTNYSYYND